MYHNKFILLIFGLWFCCTVNAQQIPDVINIKDVVATELSCEEFMDGKIEVVEIIDHYCKNTDGTVTVRMVETDEYPEWFAMFDAVTGDRITDVDQGISGDGMSCTFSDVANGKYFFKAGYFENSCVFQSDRDHPVELILQKPDLSASEVSKIICYNDKATITVHAKPYNTEGSSENTITAYWLKGILYGETEHTKDNKFDELNGDTYTLYAQDSNGCTSDTTVIIAEPKAPILFNLIEEIQPIGNKKGSLTVEISGGWEVYDFVFRKIVGPSQQVLETRDNQPAGEHSFFNLDAAEYQIQILRDKEGCTKAYPFLWTLEMATGETDFRSAIIKIFPNPSDNGRFNIEWNNNENRKVTLELYNALGQLVYKSSTQTGANTALDFGSQSSGAYLLHVPELNIRQKLIIQ